MIILFICFLAVSGLDLLTVNFVKNYIGNENKPTVLYINYLCWPKDTTINLFNTLSGSGIRVSSVLSKGHLGDNHHVLFLVDLNCSNVEFLFNATDNLRSPYRWLLLIDAREIKKHRYLWHLPIPLNSDFVVAARRNEEFILTEIYKPSLDGITESVPRGYFHGSLVDTRPSRELFERRHNVMGHPITMSNVVQDSNTTIYHLPRQDRLKLQYDADAKLNWMVFHIVAQMVNATPRYIFSHRYGYKYQGQWSGMIRDLQDGRADLGTNCYANVDRMHIVVFTECIAPIEVKFILRQPPLSYVANIFTLPFTSSVWLAVLAFTFVSGIAVYLACKCESSSHGNRSRHVNFTDALFFTISSLSQQNTEITEAKNLSSRLMLWWIFIAMMSLYTAYSANIVVLLQAPSTTITTLEQLKNSKLTIAAVDADYNHFILKAEKDPIRQAIYKRIVPDSGKSKFCRFNECLEELRKGFFAFHVILGPVYRYIDEHFLDIEKCGLTEIDYLNGGYTYVPVYKFLPYLELLRVRKIRETGIRFALQKRLLQAKPRCTNQSAFTSVGLTDLRPVILLMIFGVTASIAVLIAEILYIKCVPIYIVNEN